jgi:hypothetical protein
LSFINFESAKCVGEGGLDVRRKIKMMFSLSLSNVSANTKEKLGQRFF